MAELELETIDRAVRWCAEAGRQTTAVEVRSALGTLGWDQLLAVRALLADPPPAHPLGPHALADMARGVPADLAAEREREARYPRPGTEPPARPVAASPSPPAPAPRKSARRSRRAQVLVRKPVAATPAMASQPPRRPLLEELLLPAGRADLERLIRTHGGRRPRLVAAIAASHRRADGAPLGDADLDAVLEHHGLDRAYGRRERDELVHAVRAAGAILAQAASALGHDLASLVAAITRLGLDADVKRLRDARRRDLRSRATLSERALLLVGSAEKLVDLELLEEFERDLAKRLPDHLRALSGAGEPLELSLARTLALPVVSVRSLLARLGVELRAPAAVAPATAGSATARPARSFTRDDRPGGGARPPSRTAPGGRPSGSRPSGSRSSGSRSSGSRSSGSRPSGSRPSGSRPSGSRPSGSRPSGSRPSGSRPSGSRPSGPRPSGPRPSGTRMTGRGPPGSRPPAGGPGAPRRPAPGGGRRGSPR